MGLVPVQDIYAAVDVVSGVSGFCFVLGLLLNNLNQAINAFWEPFVFSCLLKHLKPHDVLSFEALNLLEVSFVDLVDVSAWNKR